MCDPRHPKQAVWIANGTSIPARPFIVEQLRRCEPRPEFIGMPEGILVTRHFEDIVMLRHTRDDRTLAEILGYLEPKWDAGGQAVVVRALDDDGCVITEFAVSPERAGEAYEIVKQHGTPELTTIEAVLERRRILCAAEAAEAA